MILNTSYHILINCLCIIIVSISTCGIGIFFNNFFKINYSLEKLFFNGILLKIIIVFFINLFFSLNIYVNSFLVILGFYFFFKNINFIKDNNNFYFILFIPLIALISLRDAFFFDNLLYHIPLINLSIDSNLVIGQSNINLRYGIPTLIFSAYSSLYLPFLNYSSVFILNSVIFLFFIKFFIDEVKIHNSFIKDIFIILLFFLLLDALIHPLPVGLFLGRLGSPEYDFLTGILNIYFIFYSANSIYNKNLKSDIYYITILFLLALLIKPTSFSTYFIFLWILFLLRNDIFFVIRKNLLQFFSLFLVLIIFVTKIFFNTGCLFPYLSFSCFDVSWFSKEIIQELSSASISWKGYTTNVRSLSDLSWVGFWFKNYFLSTGFFIYFIIFVLIYLLTLKIDNRSDKNDFIGKKIWTKILIFKLISLILWFITSPDLRYAWSIFIIIYSILILSILTRLNLLNKFLNLINFSKYINLYLFIILSLLSFKNLYHFDYDSFKDKFLLKNNYEVYKNKNLVKINVIKNSNFAHYKLCSFIPNPCAINKEILKNLNYEKKYFINFYNFK